MDAYLPRTINWYSSTNHKSNVWIRDDDDDGVCEDQSDVTVDMNSAQNVFVCVCECANDFNVALS